MGGGGGGGLSILEGDGEVPLTGYNTDKKVHNSSPTHSSLR